MTSLVRKPHVAGSFYPAEPQALRDYLQKVIEPTAPTIQAKAVIIPHAGYLYSGRTAAEVIRRINIPKTAFLIGPNHWGVGEAFALFSCGSWENPLGKVPVDEEFASGLLESSHDIRVDTEAHFREHSLEVEIPFLQYRNPSVAVVPLLIGTLNWDNVADVAFSMEEFLRTRSDFLIVCSTDMNHYENDKITREKDGYALEAIKALDEKTFRRAVVLHQISMCGCIPVYMTLILSKSMGAKRAELVDYRTSADASGDRDRVVGYAGFIIY